MARAAISTRPRRWPGWPPSCWPRARRCCAPTRAGTIWSRTGPSAHGRWLQGAAFERVDESPLDLRAWIDLLARARLCADRPPGTQPGRDQGDLHAGRRTNPPQVAALVAVSPPRLSYAYFCQSRAGRRISPRPSTRPKRLVASGHGDELMLVDFPLHVLRQRGRLCRSLWSRRAVRRADAFWTASRCPTLVTYGSSEMQADLAFRGMSEAVEKLATHGELARKSP